MDLLLNSTLKMASSRLVVTCQTDRTFRTVLLFVSPRFLLAYIYAF